MKKHGVEFATAMMDQKIVAPTLTRPHHTMWTEVGVGRVKHSEVGSMPRKESAVCHEVISSKLGMGFGHIIKGPGSNYDEKDLKKVLKIVKEKSRELLKADSEKKKSGTNAAPESLSLTGPRDLLSIEARNEREKIE